MLLKVRHHQLIHAQQLVENIPLHKLVSREGIQWRSLANLVANFEVLISGEVQVLLDGSKSILAHR